MRRYWAIPLLVIVLLLVFSILSIYIVGSTPSTEVEVQAECEKVKFPVSVELTTKEFSELWLWGFQGNFKNIRVLSVTTSGGGVNTFKNMNEMTLETQNEEDRLPLLVVHQPVDHTLINVIVGPGVGLQADKARVLKLTSKVETDITMGFKSRELILSKMMNIKVRGQPVQFENMVSLNLRNHNLFSSKFVALLSGKGRNVTMELKGSTVSIKGKTELAGDIFLENCSSVSIKFKEPKSSSYVTKNKAFDFMIRADGLTLEALTNRCKKDKNSVTGICLKMSGKITAALESEVEVVPTRLQLIFNRPPHEQGVFGVVALFLVFAGGVFLKRALEVLAMLAIPEK